MPQKAFSKIWLSFIIVILIGGGFLAWQQWATPKEEVGPADETELIDETANWQTYRNEEYGFEVKYPKEDTISFYEDTTSFGHQIEMLFPCSGNFWVRVWDNPPHFSVEDFILAKYGGGAFYDRAFLENIVINGIDGVHLTEELRLPPGGGAMRNATFFLRNSRVYEIAYSPDYEIMSVGMEVAKGCTDEQDKIFNQMLSSFRFIERIEGVVPKEECAKEGELECDVMGCRACCSGLEGRYVKTPMRNKNNEVVCIEEMTRIKCLKCGDTICGNGEDWCVCPEDCQKPNPEDLELSPY